MLRFPLITLLAFMLILPSANAVEINNEGEARLRALLTTFIDGQKTFAALGEGEIQINDGDDIIIEQAKTYYAATLPKLTHISDNGSRTEMSLISINAVPTDNPEDWKMSITMPKSITVINKEGTEKQKISFGSQKMQGLWSHDLNSFSKWNADYDNITIISNNEPVHFTIDNLKVTGNLKQTQNGKWSGPLKSIVSGIKLEKRAQEYVSIGEIGSNFELTNFDPVNYEKLLETIDASDKEGKSVELSQVMEAYGPDYDLDMTIKNIKANAPERINKKGVKKEAINVSIDQAFFKLGSASGKNQKVDYNFKMGYRDLKANDLEEFAPANLNINLIFENLPVQELKEIVNKMNLSTANPNSAKVATLQGIMALPPLLSDAQTTFEIKNTGFSNHSNNLNFNMNGHLKATPSAPIGDIQIKIEGLDNMVENLENKKESAEPATVSTINSTLKNIQTIQLFSKKKGNSDLLHLKITDDAKVLINGKDISLLMGRKPVEPITIESATQKDN